MVDDIHIHFQLVAGAKKYKSSTIKWKERFPTNVWTFKGVRSIFLPLNTSSCIWKQSEKGGKHRNMPGHQYENLSTLKLFLQQYYHCCYNLVPRKFYLPLQQTPAVCILTSDWRCWTFQPYPPNNPLISTFSICVHAEEVNTECVSLWSQTELSFSRRLNKNSLRKPFVSQHHVIQRKRTIL